MATDLFANNAATTLLSAVSTTPVAGTSENWNVSSSGSPLPQPVTSVRWPPVIRYGKVLEPPLAVMAVMGIITFALMALVLLIFILSHRARGRYWCNL